MGFQRGESVYTLPAPAVELWSPEKRIIAMHTDSAPGGASTPGIVFENLQVFQRTAALKAAIGLDVFRAVGQEPGDVASIARHAAVPERGIRILCDSLVVDFSRKRRDATSTGHRVRHS
jgi:hypothetical protein